MLEGRRRGQRVKADQRAKIAEVLVNEYQKGKSIRMLAKEYQVSIGLARNLLIDGGVNFRSRGGGRAPE